MIEIEKPRIEVEELSSDGQFGRFVVEPLERGFGITLGNALRRVLLSSLPGAAITSVKINGVVHEFSTIPGVVEDVPELIVNLKSVRLKVFDNDEKIIRIDHKGAGEITAGDIVTDGTVETFQSKKEAGRAFNKTNHQINNHLQKQLKFVHNGKLYQFQNVENKLVPLTGNSK